MPTRYAIHIVHFGTDEPRIPRFNLHTARFIISSMPHDDQNGSMCDQTKGHDIQSGAKTGCHWTYIKKKDLRLLAAPKRFWLLIPYRNWSRYFGFTRGYGHTLRYGIGDEVGCVAGKQTLACPEQPWNFRPGTLALQNGCVARCVS